jgi:hypothetical protein
VKDYPAAIDKLKQLLDDFAERLDEPDLRDKVLALVPAVYALRDLGSSLLSRADASAARDRILFYLRNYPLTLISGDELMVVSGISDWPRRVRELRVQLGWSIASGTALRQIVTDDPVQRQDLQDALGVDPEKIKPDQYVLLSDVEDRDAAHRWHQLNTIRRKKAGVKDKLLEYLRANVGRAITGEELRYLASNRSEWARRTRELRTENGWPVVTRQQGRPDLPIGTYMLEEDKQAPEHDRAIPDAVRVVVLERDGFACKKCGWSRDKASKDDPRRLLELHHILDHVLGGGNEADNLVTVCNVHHDQIHAGKLNAASFA